MIAADNKFWWKIALELKLRKCSGDAFQDFFSTMMALAHGSDFVRVRAFGALGDKGCDGYLQSSGKVYACYGAINAAGYKVAYLIKKMGEDFVKAHTAIAAIMKEWHMVHNLVDGLPTDAILKLEELKAANKAHRFGSWDWRASRRRFSRLKRQRSKSFSAWPPRHTISKTFRQVSCAS